MSWVVFQVVRGLNPVSSFTPSNWGENSNPFKRNKIATSYKCWPIRILASHLLCLETCVMLETSLDLSHLGLLQPCIWTNISYKPNPIHPCMCKSVTCMYANAMLISPHATLEVPQLFTLVSFIFLFWENILEHIFWHVTFCRRKAHWTCVHLS